ncbi:hypothetical protein DDE74_39205 [Streptomyces lydicus]|uniref:CoA transferase n=1 Tax=Streptomyces lydicus TaxID=47763 RepID=A0A3Q9KFY1_9ACTN|nr:CoA transferase [Streptomyces lydicus]AZS76088.1 hypothetical protein DDE74_39205 [Streptomyces lydicus]
MTGPLADLKVVEVAGIGPAPFATMLLADLGADGVRNDRPGHPSNPVPPEHDFHNCGRPSIELDLKDPDGAATARRLTAHADDGIEGYRLG